MEDLLRNPGFHHIVEKSLKLLSNEDIASFRLSNRDCKNIVDYPGFYLMKLSHQKKVPKNLIQEWKKMIQKLNDDNVEEDLMLELFKMNCKRMSKYPLQLSYDLSDEKKKLKLAKFIIENSNKEISVKAKEGKTGELSPIHLAAMYGYVESANRMISNNSTEPNPSDIYGITPIYLAAQNGHLEMVRLLMTLTTNPNGAINDGRTPIHQAVTYGHLEIIQCLMTSTTNPNIADLSGWTPIHTAAGHGYLEIVQLLMTSTTNPNVADNSGETPIHLAAANGHPEIIKLLMTLTTNPNIADNDGWTPIHSAAFYGHLETVRLLMKTTNNPNAPDNLGRSAENLASQRGHHDIVRMLKNLGEIRSLVEAGLIYPASKILKIT